MVLFFVMKTLRVYFLNFKIHDKTVEFASWK